MSKEEEYIKTQNRLLDMQKPQLVNLGRLVNNSIKENLIKDLHRIKKDKLVTELMLRYDILKKHINSNINLKKSRKSNLKIDPKTGKIDKKQNEELNKKLKKQIEEMEKQIQANIKDSLEFEKKNTKRKKKK